MSAVVERAAAPAPGRPFFAQPSTDVRELAVIVYHYVISPDCPRNAGMKGIALDTFRDQVAQLGERYEMASLEAALAFLDGRYTPQRSLCVLTFDDGLREHLEDVTPLLSEKGIEGLFFVTTDCLNGRVATVHKNHRLLAGLEFARYRREAIERMRALAPNLQLDVDAETARRACPWDTPDVAAFKYLLNYQAPVWLRTQVLDDLFAEHMGDEAAAASELYVGWDGARAMQDAGMTIGGHTRRHQPLRGLDRAVQHDEIAVCGEELRTRLRPQALWPFSYPYGSFDDVTASLLTAGGFHCGFALDGGANAAGADVARIRRIDTADLRF